MVNKKDLRGGIVKMREVAQLLTGWADDLEASFQDQKAGACEVGESRTTASGGNLVRDEVIRNERAVRGTVATIEEADPGKSAPAEKRKKTPAAKAAAEPAAEEKKAALLTLPEVRAVLAEKCSKGFRAQVKALIDSFGASALRDVAPEHYGELLEAASGLGGEQDAG